MLLRRLVFPLFAITLLACGAARPPVTSVAPAPVASSSKAQAAAPPETTAPVETPPAALPTLERGKVVVLDPGAEPRRKLRYRFGKNAETAVLDMRMDLGLRMGDRDNQVSMPTIRMVMRIVPKGVSKDGTLTYEAQFKSTELLKDVALDDRARVGMEKELGHVVGLTIRGKTSDRGEALETSIDIPDGIPPATRETLGRLRDAMRDICVPLPEEEIGKGARWEREAVVDLGVRVRQKATFTLVSLDAKGLKVTADVTQSAPPQEMKVAAMPPGAKAMLDSLKSAGHGVNEATFTGLVPRSKAAIQTETTMTVIAGEERVASAMRIGITVTIAPK
jgi:hypothetical protein